MKPFVINRYGRIVFPFNFFPELDFSTFQTLEQFGRRMSSGRSVIDGDGAPRREAVWPPM